MQADPTDAQHLARALAQGLRADFPERDATALALAELTLDATEAVLPLLQNGPARVALDSLELLATSVDLYSWDGPPGWDEVLARGLAEAHPLQARGPVLDGLGDAKDRKAQLELLHERARNEAAHFLSLGKQAALGASAEALISLHAALLRLVALAVAAGPLQLPEDPEAGALPPPGEAALVAEMDERARAGSDFAGAQEEWLARLQHENPAAATPGFRTFFAGLGQSLRVALALRHLRDEAREGTLSADLEALLGGSSAWQPVRWSALRGGAPALYFAELFPPVPALPPLQTLARECSAALDLAGRLWGARQLSLTGFTALASALTARCASVLALWEELSIGGAA